jgi:hypothetical protein
MILFLSTSVSDDRQIDIEPDANVTTLPISLSGDDLADAMWRRKRRSTSRLLIILVFVASFLMLFGAVMQTGMLFTAGLGLLTGSFVLVYFIKQRFINGVKLYADNEKMEEIRIFFDLNHIIILKEGEADITLLWEDVSDIMRWEKGFIVEFFNGSFFVCPDNVFKNQKDTITLSKILALRAPYAKILRQQTS